MNHPAKRQRLEAVPRFSNDDDALLSDDDEEQLHPEIRDRIAIRNRFKSALEGIFEKYGRDFTGIGDEIDLRTGEVVVDNGHIMRMEDEGDAGGDITLSEEDLSTEEELEESEMEATDTGKLGQLEDSVAGHKANGQQKKEQALESLNLDMIVNKLSQSSQSRSTSLAVKAKDPKWQIPDLPESAFKDVAESESDSVDDSEIREASDLGLQRLKSPKKSLWRDARYTRICKRVPTKQKRGRRRKIQAPIWNDTLNGYEGKTSLRLENAHNQDLHINKASRIQYYDSRELRHQTPVNAEHSIKTTRESTVRQATTHPSEKETEWSVLEEQQLIRYRLNTPLSFAALAPKFPGRNAEMLRDKWQHLKKKFIEISMMTKTSTNPGIKNSTTEVQDKHQKTSDEQDREHHNTQDDRHVINGSRNRQQEESASRMQKQANKNSDTSQQHPYKDIGSETVSEESDDEELTARFPKASNYPHEAGNNPSAVVGLSGIPLEDMWKSFPAIGQLQDIGNVAGYEDQDQDRFEFDMASWQHPIWSNQNPQVAPLPFSVPYGPLEHIDPLTRDQGSSSVLSINSAAQIDGAFNAHNRIQESDDFLTTYTDVLHADNIGIESPTVASLVDFTTAASDTLAQDTNYTPESLRGWMQNTRDLILPDTENVDPWVTHYDQQQLGAPPYFGSASNAELTQPIQMASIPNTTQDDGSLTFLKSSGNRSEHAEAASEPLRIPSSQTKLTVATVPTGSEQKSQIYTGNPSEASAFRSRASSPLSSTSSSDPRIARPSELSSSMSNRGQKADKLPEVVLETIDPAILLKIPLEVSAREELKAQAISEPNPNDTQNIIKSKTSTEDVDLVQEIISIPATIEKMDKVIEEPDEELGNSKQKLLSGTTENCKISMEFAVDTMRMLNDSLEHSCILLETAAKQRAVAKPPTTTRIHPSLQLPLAKNSMAITSCNKTFRSNSRVCDNDKAMSRKNAQQIKESAESLWSAFDELNQATTIDTRQHIRLPRKKDTAVDKGNKSNSRSSVKDQDQPPNKNQYVLQSHREATPIDTYCYMLADPWPEDPLPKDRIPGVRDVPDSKKQSSTSRKTSKSGSHDHNQAFKPSSIPTSPIAGIIKSGTDQQSKTKGYRDVRSADMQNQSVQSRRNEPDIVSDDRTEENISRDGPGIENTKLVKPHSTNPSLVELDLQSRPSKSSKHFTKGRSTKTRREGSSAPRHDDGSFPLESSGGFAENEVISSPRKQSPAIKSADLLFEYGKGRPLTRANLLSQDEVPSTSQDTVLSFLNSQATQLSRPMSTPRSSLLARQAGQRSTLSAAICGVNGFRCGRTLCFKCTSRTAKQGEDEF